MNNYNIHVQAFGIIATLITFVGNQTVCKSIKISARKEDLCSYHRDRQKASL
ncbi:hypothetical protein PO909_014499 [Leuciscus waleckii]